MKITGRNIKRRLYGLKNLPSHIKRARYFRGHGVHSPFVYAIVRQVFMRSTFACDDRELYEALIAKGVVRRRAMQLQNLFKHLHYSSYCINPEVGECSKTDMIISTPDQCSSHLTSLADLAREWGSTLCIIAPALDSERDKVCRRLVEEHRCTSVDNRGYLLLFNNHLPKQKFRL